MQCGANSQITDIHKAREEYFRNKPFDVHENALMAHDENGLPSGFLTMPNFGELQVVACKLGFEYLALCTARNSDLIDEWVGRVSALAKSPELAGILFAKIFQGIDDYLGSIFEMTNLGEAMPQIAVGAWEKDFSDFAKGDEDE